MNNSPANRHRSSPVNELLRWRPTTVHGRYCHRNSGTADPPCWFPTSDRRDEQAEKCRSGRAHGRAAAETFSSRTFGRCSTRMPARRGNRGCNLDALARRPLAVAVQTRSVVSGTSPSSLPGLDTVPLLVDDRASAARYRQTRQLPRAFERAVAIAARMTAGVPSSACGFSVVELLMTTVDYAADRKTGICAKFPSRERQPLGIVTNENTRIDR